MGKRRIRILLAETGIAAHERAIMVARNFRDSGMEVIFTGAVRSMEEVAHTAVQEDVDIIVLSMYNGVHKQDFTRLRELLDSLQAGDILVIGGGTLPEDDRREVVNSGAAAAMFPPGTPPEEIVDWINGAFAARKR